MRLNADFSRRVVVDTARMQWTASPSAGVDRKMLDRIGGEVARATSIVRYAPGSRFAAHTHGGGEEFLVLEGVFQDEHGDYPAGCYVRNPPRWSHTPGSSTGCVLFVKLWQFDPQDRQSVRIDTAQGRFEPLPGRTGVAVLPLFDAPSETVRLERWSPNAQVSLAVPGGAELLVLDGSLEEGGDRLERHAWLRLPPGAVLRARAGVSGCRVWIKTGHLLQVRDGPPG